MKKAAVATVIIILLSLAILAFGCNPLPKKGLTPPNQKKNTGPQTFIPKGMAPKDYVKKYYNYVIKGETDKAYDMLPSENKGKQSKDRYKSMHKSLNIKSFKVKDVQSKDNTQQITVELELQGYPGWKVLWIFIKHKKGWIAVSSQSAQAK